jgi:hypothetical protein
MNQIHQLLKNWWDEEGDTHKENIEILSKSEIQRGRNQVNGNPSIAHIKALELIKQNSKPRKSGIIPFPEINKILSHLYHFKKSETKKFIAELRALDLITFHPYHGFKLK